MAKTKGLAEYLPAILALVLVVITLMGLFIINVFERPRRLYPAEVRNYQGQELSSIADVRENAIRGNQLIDNSTYRLAITGLVENPVNLTYSEIVNNHQTYMKVVYLYCVQGWSATILWEGVLLKDLLNEAGANTSAQVVIFYAEDGFSTSLPLDYIINKNIILAYKMNNLTIPPEKGFPFQLVAESQYGYKWIKWVTEIEVSNDTAYEGYWESRGYPNNATIAR